MGPKSMSRVRLHDCLGVSDTKSVCLTPASVRPGRYWKKTVPRSSPHHIIRCGSGLGSLRLVPPCLLACIGRVRLLMKPRPPPLPADLPQMGFAFVGEAKKRKGCDDWAVLLRHFTGYRLSSQIRSPE
jgi:hypothetical protein